MPRIVELTMESFKAQQVRERLTGLDIFVGPNGAGKSARLEAASLAILGYVPGRGRRADDTMLLAAGDSLSVGLTLDNGFGCARTFDRKTTTNRRTGEVTVKVTERISVSPARGEANDTERKARIAAELGSFGVHLDFSEFLALSAGKRREFLYGLVSGAQEWTRERVEDLLRRHTLTDELRANRPEAYAAMEETIRGALGEWKAGLSVQDGITAMLEWAKAQASYWNGKRRDAEGAVRQLAELKNQLAATDRNIAERKAALEAMREELTAVTAEIARAQEIRTSWEDRRRRMAELQQAIDRIGTAAPDVSEIDAQIERLSREIVEIVPGSPGGAPEEQKAAAIAREIEAVNGELEQVRRAKAAAEAEAATLRRAMQAASSTGGLCVISRLIRCEKDFRPFVSHVAAEADKREAAAQEAARREAALMARHAQLRNEQRDLMAAATARLTAIAERQRANERVRAEIRRLEAQKAGVLKEAEAASLRREAMAAELARLEAEPVRPVPETEILEKQAAGLRTQIAEAQASIYEQEQARTTLANMQGAMLENSRAEDRYNAARVICEELGPHGVQGELLKAGLEPLRAEIDANLRALGMPHRFAFLTRSDRGAETFDFGWLAGETFVSYDALSTGQRILVLVAMLTALLDRARPPVRLLTIDNVEALDPANRAALLEGLVALHAGGKLDNVLAAGIVEDAPEGWTVHRVDGAACKAAGEVA